MLTAIVRADGDEAALAATISVLIPAVVAGALGHAVVVTRRRNAGCERLADLTGADYLVAPDGIDPWRIGAQGARGFWLLLIEAGEVPEGDWMGAIERHLIRAPDAPALLPLAGGGRWRERLSHRTRPRVLRPGLLAPRGMCVEGRLDASPRLLPARRRAG